jgi:hypothetical protein
MGPGAEHEGTTEERGTTADPQAAPAEAPLAATALRSGARSPMAVLALQRAAGNAAVGRMLSRQPATALPGSPEAGPRPLAVTLSQGIQTELDQARLQRLSVQIEVDDLEERQAALSTQDAARLTELKTRLGALDKTIKAGEDDLAAVRSPATSDKALNDMLARRNQNVGTAKTESATGTGEWQLTDKGWVKSSGTQSSQLVKTESGSKSVTTETASKTTIGAGTYSTADTSKTTSVQGDKTTSVEKSKGTSVDLLDPSVTKSSSTKQAVGEDSKETATSTKVGLSGYQSATTVTEKAGGQTTKTASTFGVTRGDGQIAAGGTKTVTKGTVNEEGKLTGGTETKTSAKGSLIVDPDKGIGAGGDAGAERKTVSGPMSYTGGGSLSGKVLLNVTQVAGKDPPAFQATLTINFGVKASGGVGGEKESGASAVTGGGSVAGSLSATATFTRTLDDATAKHYIAAVQSGGAGAKPSFPEWRIIEVGLTQDWVSAKRMYDELMGTTSAADAAAMKEGEEVGATAEKGVEGKLSAGGKSGALSLGFEYGRSTKGSLTFGRKMLPDGILQLTVGATSESGETYGGTVGMGAAGGSASFGSTAGAGRTVTFNLDTKDTAYSSRYARIMAAANMAEIVALARDPDLAKSLKELKESASKSSSETVKVNVGPAAIELGGTGTLDEEKTRDATGQVTATKVTGAYKGGGAVSAGSLKVGDSVKEAYTGEVEVKQVVDEKGTVVTKQVAKGDLTKATTESSWDKTVSSVTGAVKQGSVAPLFGTPVKDETKTEGHKVHDPEIRAIIGRAKGDLGGWMKSVASPNLRPHWQKCRDAIRAACPGDDETRWDIPGVQRALAEWQSEAYKGGREAILSAAGGGGFAYHFPPGTESMQPLFEKIVGGYPAQKAEVLLAQGKLADAKTECEAQLADAQKLHDYLMGNAGKFDAAKYASMLDGATQAKTKLEGLRRTIQGKLNPAKPPPKPKDAQEAANQAAAEKASDNAAALGPYHDMVDLCRRWQESVGRLVGAAEAELNRAEGVFSSKADLAGVVFPKLNEAKDLLAKWDAKYWEAFRLMEQHGFDRSYIERFHPAGMAGYHKRVYDRSLK